MDTNNCYSSLVVNNILKFLSCHRPVLTAIRRAYISKRMEVLEQMKTILEASRKRTASQPQETDDTDGLYKKAYELMQQERELSEWADIGDLIPFPDLLEQLACMIRVGVMSEEEVRVLLNTPKGKGAPPSERQKTIEAFDAKIVENLTWKQLAERFCTYKKPHDRSCSERIRANVQNSLKPFLRKYGLLDPAWEKGVKK